VNASALSNVAAGGSVTLGFVLSGNAPHQVLIRAIGPGLSPYGFTSGLAHPSIALFHSGQQIATNTAGWGTWDVNANGSSNGGAGTMSTGTDTSGSGTSGSGSTSGTGSSGSGGASYTAVGVPLTETFNQAGAFSLTSGSADAAMALNLQPGPYTIVVNGATGESGPVLVEVYYVK
jgi:hypothetical protein